MGLDPGTTTGIAVLDLDGELVAWKSQRHVSQADRNRFIVEQGRPVIVATDVSPTPSAVEDLAATFGTRCSTPDRDLSAAAKKDLVSGYDADGFDTHASDALAAAVNAWNSVRPLVEKARTRCEDAGLSDDETDSVLYRVLTMEESISTAIGTVQREREQDTDDRLPAPDSDEDIDWEQRARRYREERDTRAQEAERLREYVDELREDLEQERTRREQLEAETGREVREQEIVQELEDERDRAERKGRRLENRVTELENRIERLEQALGYAASGESVLPICGSAEELAAIDGPIAYVTKHLQVEPPEPVEVVIVEREEDAAFYRERGLATADYRELPGMRLDDQFIVDEEAVLDAAEDDGDGFMEWLEAYRRRDDGAV